MLVPVQLLWVLLCTLIAMSSCLRVCSLAPKRIWSCHCLFHFLWCLQSSLCLGNLYVWEWDHPSSVFQVISICKYEYPWRPICPSLWSGCLDRKRKQFGFHSRWSFWGWYEWKMWSVLMSTDLACRAYAVHGEFRVSRWEWGANLCSLSLSESCWWIAIEGCLTKFVAGCKDKEGLNERVGLCLAVWYIPFQAWGRFKCFHRDRVHLLPFWHQPQFLETCTWQVRSSIFLLLPPVYQDFTWNYLMYYKKNYVISLVSIQLFSAIHSKPSRKKSRHI